MKLSAFTITALFIGIVAISSCKKNNSRTNNSYNPLDTVPADIITATVSDTNYSFNIGVSATIAPSNAYHNLNITGDAYPNVNNGYIVNDGEIDVGVSYILADPLTIGSYNENNINTTEDNIAFMDYRPYDSSTTSLSAFYSNGYNSENPVIVVITDTHDTAINGNNYQIIKGTFQGNVYLNGDTTQDLKVITNGKFDVYRFDY